MNLLDKIKLLLWLKGLLSNVGKGGPKMAEFMQKLDGYKSIAGLLIVVAYYVLPLFTKYQVPDFVYKFGMGLVSVGLVHKLEKATGWVSLALQGVQKALDAMSKK